MNIDNYLRIDATGLAELVRQKEVKPSELVELSFEQLEKINPALNAVTHMRRERVLAESKRVEIGNHPFAGVPILLKNISQALQNEPLTSGARLLSEWVADHDSHFVNKLREAGFLFIGHTNTPEFGLKNITEPELYGATRNPWNPNYSPGGSSGGAAAAIASGIVPLAGASDGGGSIRIPASFSSLVGLKPTRGRTSVGPGVGRQWQGASIDFVLSRSVRDCAAMLDQLQVIQQAAAFQAPLLEGSSVEAIKQPFTRKLKIAFTTKSPVATPVSEEAQAAVQKVVKWLESEGHTVEELDNQVDGIQLMQDYFIMNSGEMAAVIEQFERAIGRTITANDVEIETWLLNKIGKSISAAKYSASLASWDTAAAQMATVHESYDLYITPSTAFAAPKIGELTHSTAAQEQLLFEMDEASGIEQQKEIMYKMFLPSLTYTPFTQLANLTGQPAISLPVHVTQAGLPLGVQVMAGKGEERLLLQVAAQLEQTDLWVGMKGNPLFE